MDCSDGPSDGQTTDKRFAMVPLATVARLAKLEPAAVLVYLVLRGHADRRGKCWPSTATIQQHTGLHDKTIGKAFKQLETAGMLLRETRKNQTNVFHLLDEMPTESPTLEGPRNGGDPKLEGPRNGGDPLRETAETLSAKRRTRTDHLTDQRKNQREGEAAADAAPPPAPLSSTNSETPNGHLPTETVPTAKPKRFVPPTREEVCEFAKSLPVIFNPKQFYDHYEANGWRQSNGLAIKDWQAAMRNWARREEKFNPNSKRIKQDPSSPWFKPLPTLDEVLRARIAGQPLSNPHDRQFRELPIIPGAHEAFLEAKRRADEKRRAESNQQPKPPDMTTPPEP